MVEKNAEFGNGFTERNLRAMRQFYLAFSIRHTLCAELSWSHIGSIMRLDDADSNLYIVLSFPQKVLFIPKEDAVIPVKAGISDNDKSYAEMTNGNQEGDHDE